MKRLTILAVVAALAFLTGCAGLGGSPGKAADYYRLQYNAPAGDAMPKQNKRVLVRVAASDAVDGPRMIISQSDYQLAYQEANRWAEPLEAAVGRVLAQGLRTNYGWVEAVPVPVGYKPELTVNLSIVKLWGTAKGEVEMEMVWQITDVKENILAVGSYQMKKSGWRVGDYGQLAERVSNMMPGLTEAVRQSLSSLDGASNKL